MRSYLHKKGKTITIKNRKTILIILFEKVIKPFVKIPLEFIRRIYQYLCAHKTKHLQKPIPHRSLILIDIFIFPEFINKDRYYNGLWEYLSEEQKKCIFFVPTIVLTPKRKMVAAYKELRTSERNFLIKEDYVEVTDLLFAIGHYFRILKMRISPVKLLGEDMSSLIYEEFRSMKGFTSAVDGILNYRFAKRLKDKNIKLSLVIDWFENQVMDKGWNAGFRKYYSNVKTIGYRGLVPARLSLSQMYPTEQEQQSMVLPSEVAVIGKGFIASTKKYARNLSVEAAPAFRFRHVWEETNTSPDPMYFTVLVGLSIIPAESFHILRFVAGCLPDLSDAQLRFRVKPHPTMSVDALKRGYGSEWPEKFELADGTPSDLIRDADILISGMSSICLESMSLGVPAIVVESLSGLGYNPIPEEVPQVLWRLCATPKEIVKTIDYYMNRPEEEIQRHKDVGRQIREEYFEQVTEEGVMRFLSLDESVEREHV